VARSRTIVGLKWAMEAECPHAASRSSGARLKGLRYERAVAKALGSGWVHGQWFQFEDFHGLGYCQPDLFQVRPSEVVVLECKLTDTPEARRQLYLLYKPVLEMVYGKPMRGVVAAQALTPQSSGVVHSLEEALRAPGAAVWHLPWPGAGHTNHEDKPTSAGTVTSWLRRRA